MKRFFTILALLVLLASPSFATVSDTNSPVKVYSSGTATTYTIPFDYISDSDIVVTLVNAATGAETAQTIDVDYTIVASAVTYSTAPGSAYQVVIRRKTPYTQEASFSAGEAPPLSTYESAYDKLCMLTQDLDERMDRAPLLPEATATRNVTWPDLALNAGKLVRINTDGDGLEAIATVAAGSALDVTAYCDAADLTKLHASMSNPGRLSDYDSVSDMVTTIGATEKTVFLDVEGVLSVNTTIPSTLHLVALKGGFITLGNYNLTINGPFSAGLSKVFDCTGTGDAVFGAGSVPEIYPEWWGIDGAADDVQINAAIAAAPTGGTVVCAGTYTLTSPVLLNKAQVSLLSYGLLGATFTTAEDINAIVVSATNCGLENIKVTTTNASATGAGVLLQDGATLGRYRNVWCSAFANGFEFSSAAATGVAYNDFFGCRTSGITGACIYIHHTGSPAWVNENHFFGGSHTATTAGRLVNIASFCNQNTFNNVSFEGGNPNLFCFIDHGTNTFEGCRVEVSGHGFYVHNDSSNSRVATRIHNAHWSLDIGKVASVVVDGRLMSDSWFFTGSCNGYIVEGDALNTTVNQDSAAAAAVLYLASTTGLFKGSHVVIDEGGANEEWNIVKSIDPGVSVTLWANLASTHTASDAHVVSSHGLFYGISSYPWEGHQYTYFFTDGARILTLNSTTGSAYFSGAVEIGASQVVTSRQTGVSAMTNLTAPANLDANTVSTAELADIVGNLINKLRTHGLVGD